VRIPPTVLEIGRVVFRVCWGLIEVKLCERLQTIGRDAFMTCYSLERLILPSTITEIGAYAFCDCSSLNEMVLCMGLRTIIGGRVFWGCRPLKSRHFFLRSSHC
ncbi:hypothetical protein ACHAWF_001679, partial [Thalassiosira exigua]